jgi:hypothetical protein
MQKRNENHYEVPPEGHPTVQHHLLQRPNFGFNFQGLLGMASYLIRSFTMLGVVMLAPTLEYARQKDYIRAVDKKLNVSIKAKTSRAKIQSAKQRAAYKMAIDPKMKSYEYRSGIRMEVASQEYEKEKKRKEKQAEDSAVELALTGKQMVTGIHKRNEKKHWSLSILWVSSSNQVRVSNRLFRMYSTVLCLSTDIGVRLVSKFVGTGSARQVRQGILQ